MRIRSLFLLFFSLYGLSTICAQDFNKYFSDNTLRADYIFSGNATTQEISLSGLSKSAGWAGRRVNLDTLLLQGNAQVTMTDCESGRIIYKQALSTLFQEWQHTEEATNVRKAFENTILLPLPLKKARITVTLCDNRRKTVAEMSHFVNPDDILIRHARKHLSENVVKDYLINGKSSNCIDLLYIAEGYTEAEMPQFYADVEKAVHALFSHKPFDKYRKHFNIRTIAIPSECTDVSEPLKGKWHETPAMSHFSTFYSDRYLMTEHLFRLHDLIEGIPFEHIVILANTPTYGGGGIYNLYMLTSARQKWFEPVVVHEFGHSFAGLADEYFYDDQYETYYPADTEPWELNVTTLADFDKKWRHMVKDVSLRNTGDVGIYEGAGYQSKGVYRGSFNCRMRTNEYPEFCPVCRESIEKVIKYHIKSVK